MALRAANLVCVAALLLGACGSSGGSGVDGGSCTDSPSRSPKPGEGALCTPPGDGGSATGNCPDSLNCVDWSAYAAGYFVCRLPCGSGCPTGESCTKDQGGATTSSCQCTPAEAPCATTDSCSSIGLECDPNFHVCLAPVSSTSCTTPLHYSTLWQLCLGD